ncbi:MAG: ATP-binding protein [Chloroflexota bacterium]|nr:ATP-binding protein [Chloroflexota bacterium]
MTGGFPFNGTNGDGFLPHSAPFGMVVGGSLSDGVEIRLHPSGSTLIEDVKVGTFVTIQGKRYRFFGVITDLELSTSDSGIRHSPPESDDPMLLEVLSGTMAYGVVSVMPSLALPLAGDGGEGPAAAKTVPSHFSPSYPATEDDVASVFGREDNQHFWIGSPLDMDTRVCLDLDNLVRRSFGVFGKSGTGKTFLTRLLLVGILQGGTASSLIFDMHSEYGWSGQDTDRNRHVKGLKQLFPSYVSTFTLDAESSRRRGSSADEIVSIGYGEIEPEDIELLKDNLSLSDVASAACFNLQQRFGGNWMSEFLARQGPETGDLADDLGVNRAALGALHNRLSRFRRYPFLEEGNRHNAAARIIEHLERGKHVVLEFGRYGRDLNAYILVSNLLTRRIHERYVELKEEAEGGQGKDPRPLVIVIEEAHRFLNPAISSQTPFANIARELRKYNVTLMIIDQRPGGIDSEVMSQLGTRFTCALDNERDIDSVLAGAAGGRQLRVVLSRLEEKQQALVFGHAVPMPVVIHTREYGTPESYASLTGNVNLAPFEDTRPGESDAERLERQIDELFS